MEPINDRDLQALHELVQAELQVLHAVIAGMRDGIVTAYKDQERRDEQLNDVRLRFIPRDEHAIHKEHVEDRFNDLRNQQARQWRTFVVTSVSLALIIMGQAIAVVALIVG